MLIYHQLDPENEFHAKLKQNTKISVQVLDVVLSPMRQISSVHWSVCWCSRHRSDVMSAMAFQITRNLTVCSTACSTPNKEEIINSALLTMASNEVIVSMSWHLMKILKAHAPVVNSSGHCLKTPCSPLSLQYATRVWEQVLCNKERIWFWI